MQKQNIEQEAQESYTVSDLAKVHKCSKQTIYRLMNAGKLPFYMIGSSRRVSKAANDQLMQNNAS